MKLANAYIANKLRKAEEKWTVPIKNLKATVNPLGIMVENTQKNERISFDAATPRTEKDIA